MSNRISWLEFNRELMKSWVKDGKGWKASLYNYKLTIQPVKLPIPVNSASNLMAHLCNELQLGRLVNNMVTWDEKQWKVSPGTLVSALVINALVDRKPLYNVEHFYDKAQPHIKKP